MEVKAHSFLTSLYDSGLESRQAGVEDGPAKLLPFLIRALEDVTLGLGPTAEAEARVLSSTALMRVLTLVYLRDPNVDLDSLLEPASGELAAAAAEAVKGRAEALLGKFRAFSTKPKWGAADPVAPQGEPAPRSSTADKRLRCGSCPAFNSCTCTMPRGCV